MHKSYTFFFDLNMKLMNTISKVDRFDAFWSGVEKLFGQNLRELKGIATVRSVGASTRIEGSKMTNAEVEALISKLKTSKLEERDEQEVAGYFDVLEVIGEAYRDIEITESNIKGLHMMLMRYSDKDVWHRGNYKQVSNAVEATHADGTKQIVFRTAEPGIETEEAMRNLVAWYNSDTETLPIVKSALFVYDFLSIHPFQDGNGRLSRLLATLLLLRNGYSWIQYISFEHEIETRKTEYYKVLMEAQRERPGENVSGWLNFYFSCLLKIQDQLMHKLEIFDRPGQLNPREKNILAFIENHPGSKSGTIARKLGLPLPTVKRILSQMTESRLITKFGVGAGTNYMIESGNTVKKGMQFQLSGSLRRKEFVLQNYNSFIEITKVILIPKFPWTKPDEWAVQMNRQQIGFIVKGRDSRDGSFSRIYSLLPYNSPFHYQPVFIFPKPIQIPADVLAKPPSFSDFPITIEIELSASVAQPDFDVMFVYDEG
jgi:Fic family protein